MRVVVAPDKFKGSVSARVAARAIGHGVVDALPDAEVVLRPLADGGEGTAEVLVEVAGGSFEYASVSGPLGRAVEASWARLTDGSAVLESAAASGLHLLAPEERDAGRATTFGTGELLLAATSDPMPTRIVVGVGGTATTDGGTGAARAAGWQFLDAAGRPLSLGGAELVRLAHIEPPDGNPIRSAALVAACDVTAPLLGPAGAARIFAPQKGASPAEVRMLEKGLETLALRIEEDLHEDVTALGHAGAGGGLGAGLAAFFGADLVSGFDFVARAVGLIDVLRDADLVITGEGRLDEQSLSGKCTGEVARLCASQELTCVALAGRVAVEPESLKCAGFSLALALTETYAEADALARPAQLLRQATRELIATGRI